MAGSAATAFALLFALADASLPPSPSPPKSWRVLEVMPRTQQQLQLLHRIADESSLEEADFWHLPSTVNSSAHLMLSPHSTLEDLLLSSHLEHSLKISDLERKLADGARRQAAWQAARPLHRDDVGRTLPVGALPLGQYHSYPDILRSLSAIADHTPHTELVDIGSTSEGRRIQGLKFGVDDGKKDVVILDAGIHAREWLTVHTALYFINMLAHPSPDPEVSSYLNRLVIYVFPVLNPDGYEFTRLNATDPSKRMWRKSRGPESCLDDGRSRRCCRGVDLNRNFAFRFGEIGSSRYACSEIYHGTGAFSEPETRAIRDFFTSLAGRIRAYITLHSYSQLWIYSYSHRKTTYPKEIVDIREVAVKAVNELSKVYGTKYQLGTGPEIIYGFAGGSTDWATESMKVKYSYTLELRPLYTGTTQAEIYNGFVVDPSELVPTGRETWAGIGVVLTRVLAEQRAGPCSDRQPACSFWLATAPSLCSSSPSTMTRDCARSCHICAP